MADRHPAPTEAPKSPWKVRYPKPFHATQIPDAILAPADRMRSGVRRVIWHTVRGLMRVVFRMEAHGVGHLPEEGPAIVISEHISLLDIPLIHLSNTRWIHWLAKVELFRNRIGFHFLPWWGALVVDRENLGSRTVREVMAVLKGKGFLGVFPQGSRCKTPEDVRTTEPKPGVARFALKTDAVIVPVAIQGRYKIFGKTVAIYGQPLKIRLPEGVNRLKPEDERALMLQMMQAIYALKGETYTFRYPADVPVSDGQFLVPADQAD